MKSYTDLEQSKKLAEFLPIESADFFWLIGHLHTDGPRYQVIRTRNEVSEPETCWPCWSLAALLEEIPEVINFDDDESDYVLEISKENDLYYLSYGNPFEHGKIEVEPQECFVDACYEMIIKLHEQNLL